jgi:hypothetical protein
MTRMVAKLLLLMAVLLMPLGMTAPAAARQHHGSSATMPMEHCPDEGIPDAKGGIAQCTMACAAALPAMDASAGEALTIVCTPELPAAVQRLHGVQPDTATPPPKAS